MRRIAFLFPGQGAQRVGMGAALLATDADLLAGYLELAEDVSGLPIGRLCREGPLGELTRTEVSQPALLALSLALGDVARDVGFEPSFVAGHSLGEYAAAVAAGVLTAEDCMHVVARRARLMADRQTERPGAMAAVIGLGVAATDALCRRVPGALGPVAVANINTHEQVVVSGVRAAVEHLTQVARDAGARVVALPVGGAFHSPLMEPVRDAMASVIADLALQSPRIPLVANVSGALLSDGEAIGRALVDQIARSVRWADCVRTLLSARCELFVELGSGVHSGLVRAIDPCAAAHAADSRERLAELAAGAPWRDPRQADCEELPLRSHGTRAHSRAVAYHAARAAPLLDTEPATRGPQ
jgi:[acyl-carrier-protein] S-malonyltransferase